jgi:CheY-like chemotaxis protein
MVGRDVHVSYALEALPSAVSVGRSALEQVLINLVVNARDAMPRGGRLSVETSAVELTERSGLLAHGVAVRPGPYALLAVTDTGHGMDKSTLAHVFEPYFTTPGVGQGTGLGLATVYGIVKQSDGYVWAYSEPGRGTTIKIYLPVTEARPETAAEEPAAQAMAAGELVLVVEDEAQVRTIAARSLSEAGYRVLVAENGEQALELLSRNGDRPALALVDVVMPGMSGSELAVEIGRLAPGVPVLFTSGYTDGEILRRGLLEPGAAFLAKPFSPEALVRAVRGRLE